MAQPTLPDFDTKQKLLHGGQASPDALLTLGDTFRDAGLPTDAVEFYHAADNREALTAMRDWAMNEGDTFIYNKTLVYLGEEAPAEAWNQIATRAFELQKLNFALQAFERAGNELMTEKVNAAIFAAGLSEGRATPQPENVTGEPQQ